MKIPELSFLKSVYHVILIVYRRITNFRTSSRWEGDLGRTCLYRQNAGFVKFALLIGKAIFMTLFMYRQYTETCCHRAAKTLKCTKQVVLKEERTFDIIFDIISV